MKIFAAALWTLLILALCSIPGDSIPDVDIFSADKLGHFTMFAVFGWLWMWSLGMPFRRALPIVVAGGLFFGIATEFYQGVLPFDREPSALDAVANALGLGAGLWLFAWLGMRRRNDDQKNAHSRSQNAPR